MLAGSPAGKNGRETLRKSALSGGTFFLLLWFFMPTDIYIYYSSGA